MGFLLGIPAVLSLLVLGAHFLRGGNLLLVAVCLGLCVLVFIRRRWAVRVVQVMLVLAAVEWLFTVYGIVETRQAEGREWMRAAMILLGVGLFNVVAAGLLGRRKSA